MKRIRTTLIDQTYTYTLDDVNDFLINNEEEVITEEDDKFWDVVNEMESMDIEDFWDNIKYSSKFGKNAYCPCVIVGTCGLWDRRREIVPVKCKNLYEALLKCANKIDYIIVKQNCSKIEFTGIHHDGRNYFEIYFLNDCGENAYDQDKDVDFTNYRYRKTLTDYII